MIVYFAGRDMNVLGVASTSLPGGLTVMEDLKTEEVETGVATFSCKLPYTAENRAKVERCAAVGNYLFRNAGLGNELYTIIETEADTEEGTVYLYAEDAGLGLLNAMALAYAAEREESLSFYFEKWLDGTGFVIGLNESGDQKKKLAWDGEATVTERLQDVAEQFDCELSFGFDIDGLNITGQYANIHRKRGKDVGAQLRLNTDVSRIVAKRTIENLATSLLVVGGTPSGTSVPVTLEGYRYDDGDCYVSGRYLNSRSALARWGETSTDGQRRQIVRLFTCDATSQEELCEQAAAELKKYSEAEVNYEIELAQLPPEVRIGDRVNVVDDEGGLYLSARILKLETSIAEDTRTATLGEYLIKDSGISQKVEELAEQIKASSAVQSRYTWIAYADDAEGNGISLNPDGKEYMGTAANQMEETVDISDPSIFSWAKIKGEPGEAGAPGEQGQKGETGEPGETGVSLVEVRRYYLLQSSGLSAPAKPTENPPGGSWTTTEPSYQEGNASELYFTDLTIFDDGTFAYSGVSLSSSYEAAKEAYGKASEASKVATNYLNFSSNGLVIGDMTANTLGSNVLIDADSLDIRNGDTVLASYQADTIYLGMNSRSSVIDLCDGTATLKNINTDPNVDWFRLSINSRDSIGLETNGEVTMDANVDNGAGSWASATFRLNAHTPWFESDGSVFDRYDPFFIVDISKQMSSGISGTGSIRIDKDGLCLAYEAVEETYSTSSFITMGYEGICLASSKVTLNNDGLIVGEPLNYASGIDPLIQLVSLSPNDNCVFGYGSWEHGLGNTHIYGKDVRVYIKSAGTSGANYYPYYRKGHSISLNWCGAGFVTGGGDNIFFTIPLAKPVIGNPTVEAVNDDGFIFRQGGKYTHGSTSSKRIKPSLKATLDGGGNCINIEATPSETTNVSNNDAIGISAHIKITFS